MVEQTVAQSDKGVKIAFIGLGRMGLPMAVILVSAGYQVTGYDRSKEAGAAFAAKGGTAADSARAAAAGAEIVITMLPTSAIVASCLVGEENALADVAPGALVIDMSSSVPKSVRMKRRTSGERTWSKTSSLSWANIASASQREVGR